MRTGIVKKTTQAAARNIIGKRVREARLAARPKISQDNLAGKLAARGISIDQTGISKIEKQRRYLMDYEISAIARSLKVSVASLFGEQNDSASGRKKSKARR